MGIYNLNCTGNETTLWDCQFNTSYNGGNCGQSNDASVFCMRKILLTQIIVVKFCCYFCIDKAIVIVHFCILF